MHVLCSRLVPWVVQKDSKATPKRDLRFDRALLLLQVECETRGFQCTLMGHWNNYLHLIIALPEASTSGVCAFQSHLSCRAVFAFAGVTVRLSVSVCVCACWVLQRLAWTLWTLGSPLCSSALALARGRSPWAAWTRPCPSR